ncbi:MAG TPA: TatD family hydrolase [Longimicrobiales bacterium]|nr:TatD family hydrolase [Longimicrobiales bacterium]
MSFDSHCHLTADAFQEDREEVMARARHAGVKGMVCIASTPADARAALALAEIHGDVWSTAGLHPHEAAAPPPEWEAEVRTLLAHPRVVAVGECGLDFHYDFAPREPQFRALEAQVGLAAETGLPLVVHSRSADSEMSAVIRKLPPGVMGVLHCFTGGDGLLEAGLDAGWYVSFSGLVTFKRFSGQAQVRAVPEDRILAETDAPYLAPVPHRGKRNEPSHVILTAARLAEIRGVDPEEFGRRLEANARAFYRLPAMAP